MSKTIRLKNPNPLPNQNDADVAKYGRAYWSLSSDVDLPVKFNLMGDAVPQDGQQITYEEWVNKESAKGTEYLQLKKVRIQGAEDSPEQVSMSTSSHTPKPAYKDNSDGMRQGMCFNNAANYIANFDSSQLIEPKDWAKTVYDYANELYMLGDLGRSESTDPKDQAKPKTSGQNTTTMAASPSLSDNWNKATGKQPDTVIEDIGDEPINLDDIPF